jgi:SAM-dependent methyltransferase
VSVFGSDYARLYETFYAQKDYRGECDLIEATSKRYGASSGRRALDIGCGIGGHTIELASRGWQVSGVDRSPAMLQIARRNATARALADRVRFIDGDAESFELGERFDVALMMFAVLGYIHENDALQRALANVRRHLSDGGLLMFDCWYGPSVLTERPIDRMHTLEGAESRTIRFAHPTLDAARHLVSVQYQVRETSGSRVLCEAEETHTMRYFFPQELRVMLGHAGFEVMSISAFPTLDVPATETTWNVFVVARA